MTLDTFFKKFDQFADAPDAVAKMRELVLELAVQGKLTSQIAGEGSAEKMLLSIHSEKVGLVKQGLLKKAESIATPAQTIKLPAQWILAPLGGLCISVTDGDHLPPPKAASGVPFLVISNVRWGGIDFTGCRHVSKEYFDKLDWIRKPHERDILYTLVGSFGIPVIVRDSRPFCVQRHIGILRPSKHVEIDYLAYALSSKMVFQQASEAATGIAQKTVPLSGLRKIAIPLPPLAEQKRIVAKVDELMALCDRLEAQQQERDEQASALARASLARFAEAPTPANLNLLFHKSYSISPAELRKAILAMAIRGKIVPRIHDDNPSVNIKKHGELITKVPFEIPRQWGWHHLSQLADINGGFAFKSHDYSERGMRVVRISDFDEFGFKDHKIVRHAFTPDLKKFTLDEGNILMAMTGGTVGKSYYVRSLPEPMIVNQRVATIKVSTEVNPSYIDILIRSEMTQEVIRIAKNSTNDNISMGDIKGFAVPLPPLAEQRRIVAKVDQLMALVDQLETQLAASRGTAKNLLEALVAELTSNDTVSSANGASHPSLGQRPRKSSAKATKG